MVRYTLRCADMCVFLADLTMLWEARFKASQRRA